MCERGTSDNFSCGYCLTSIAPVPKQPLWLNSTTRELIALLRQPTPWLGACIIHCDPAPSLKDRPPKRSLMITSGEETKVTLVLLVDDDPFIHEMIASMIDDGKYSLVSAMNAADALKI